MYRDHRKGPEGPPGGASYPGGPRGLKWEGNQPLVGYCTPHLGPLRLGLETLGGGAHHLPWGALHPPGRRPLGRLHLPGSAPPLGAYIKEGRGEGSRTPCVLAPPSPATPRPPPAAACRSPAGVLLHPPPRRCAAGSSSTSPSPLLDQEGGDVIRSVRVLNAEALSVRHLVIGDLDHGEYDSVIHVHWNASARDLQGYVDALLSLVS